MSREKEYKEYQSYTEQLRLDDIIGELDEAEEEEILEDQPNPEYGLTDEIPRSISNREQSPEDSLVMEAIRRRKMEKARRDKKDRQILLTILAVILVIISGLIFTMSDFFVIDSIEVSGNKHFTGEEIMNIGRASAGNNIIYKLGRREIVERLEDNPYIKSAKVLRKFPSTMRIVIEERSESCCLKYDNDYLVVDGEGILLRKTSTVPKLTRAEGLVVSKIKLGEKLGVKDVKGESVFDNMLSLIQSMQAADVYFVRIDMSKTSEIRAYIYESLSVVGDYSHLREGLDNGNLHKVIEKLFSDGISRGRIMFTEDGNISFNPAI